MGAVNGHVRRAVAPDLPIAVRLGSLTVELTERCDNACVHCCIALPAGDRVARGREMGTARVLDVFAQAAGLGCLDLKLTGGEPLLRPDFEDVYLSARKLGMRVTLFTNARRVTPGLAELFARVPPLKPVEVTAYGMRRESYEAVSGVPGSFTQFRRGVALLAGAGVPLVVKGALLPPNRHELDELEAWAASLPGPGETGGSAMFLELRHRRDDPAADARIAALRIAPEDAVAVLTRRPDEYRRESFRFLRRFTGPPGERLFRCGAGHTVAVDAYGWVQPCLLLRDPALCVELGDGAAAGGVTLADALDRFRGLRDMVATDPEYLRRCARCFLMGFCEQCPAKAWAEHGALDRPVDYLCDVAHAQARWLGLLAPGERAWDVTDWRERIVAAGGDGGTGQVHNGGATV